MMVLWKCVGCLATFKTYDDFEKHSKSCEGLRLGGGNNSCQFCGKHFQSCWRARTHEKSCSLNLDAKKHRKCINCEVEFTDKPGYEYRETVFCRACWESMNNNPSEKS